MKRRSPFQKFLLISGLLAMNVWIWSNAITALYQSWADRQFETDQPQARSVNPPSPQSRPTPRTNSELGRLVIPRLRLRAMVREGTGEDILTLAAGHIPNTALPGEKGNVGVAGHRDTLFRGLKNIRKNDLIEFDTLAGSYRYRVESTEIVKPEDVSVLRPGRFPELTLVTCYPFYYVGNAPERFIVKARQLEEESESTATTAPEPPAAPAQRLKKAPRVKQGGGAARPARRNKPRRLELVAISQPDRAGSRAARWR